MEEIALHEFEFLQPRILDIGFFSHWISDDSVVLTHSGILVLSALLPFLKNSKCIISLENYKTHNIQYVYKAKGF